VAGRSEGLVKAARDRPGPSVDNGLNEAEQQ
jgi:hypothetical protein